MSFADEIFDFSSCKDLTLVKGINHDLNGDANGAGKSAIFAALLYALFGEIQDKIKNEHIVNRYVKENDMRLALWFSSDDEEYKVVRGIAKKKNSYLQLFKVKGDDEVDLTKSSIAETQKMLEDEILHCDISIFLRTILLTADQTYNFYKLKKSDKKDFVEKLFDLGVFGDMYQLIHKDILLLDKKIDSIQSKLLVLNQNVETYESKSKAYDQEKQDKIELLNESISKISADLDMLNKKEVKTNDEAVKKLNEAKKKLQDAKDSLQKELDASRKQLSDLSARQHAIATMKSSKESLINKHADLLQKLCSDCKEVFSKYYSIDEALADIKKLNSESSAIISKSSEVNENCNTAKAKIAEYSSKMQLADSRIAKLQAEYNKVSNAKTLLTEKLSNTKKTINDLEKQANPYIELIAENSKSIEEETKSLDDIERKYRYLKFAENIVSQDTLRKLIVKDLISLLNNKVKTYLTKLGAKYYVKFDEDMDYEFVTTNGTCEFGNFSAGEKMRTMIATSFAFRDFMYIRNNFSSNILILDEFIDGAIDSLAIDSVLEILKDFSKVWNQNIYVISHRKEISNDVFDNIIQVVKTHNISKITYIE